MKYFLLFLLACSCGQALNDDAWQLSGSVSSGMGPVKGVFVTLRSSTTDAPIWTKIDSRGEYHLSGTKPGRYTLTVQKKDNLPGMAPRTVTLEAKQNLVLNIRVPRGGVLSGRVVDQDKQSINNVLVRAFVVRDDQSGVIRLSERGGDFTNNHGEFRIPYLEQGRYVLAATPKITSCEEHSPGHPLPTASETIQTSYYPSGVDRESAVFLDLNAAQEITDLVIQAASRLSACISFTLGADFSAGQVSGSVTPQPVTNGPMLAFGHLMANHSYRVCGLARGEYQLAIEGIAVQNRMLVVTAAQAEMLDLSKGSASIGSVEPGNTAGLSGTVTLDPKLQGSGALANIVLMLNPVGMNPNVIPTGRVQSDGTFSLPNILPAEYRLSLSNLPPGYYLDSVSQGGRDVLKRGVRPGDGDAEITLHANGAMVSGSVRTEDHVPVFDATVFVLPDNGAPPIHEQTDENSQYSFQSSLRPGTYRIMALSTVPEGQRDNPGFVSSAGRNAKEVTLQPTCISHVDRWHRITVDLVSRGGKYSG